MKAQIRLNDGHGTQAEVEGTPREILEIIRLVSQKERSPQEEFPIGTKVLLLRDDLPGDSFWSQAKITSHAGTGFIAETLVTVPVLSKRYWADRDRRWCKL